MKFLYLRDPLFLSTVVIYFINRFIFERYSSNYFWSSYLNDLICVPFWIPIGLYIQSILGLRKNDLAPESYEIIIPLLVWSLLFEVVLPLFPFFSREMTADPNDILFYSLGALIAALFWKTYYRST